MDEGWQALERDAEGRQQHNAARFPSRVSALAEHYDNCGGFHAGTHTQQERFQTISSALLAIGREIFSSLCYWGHQFPWYWADQVGAASYRMSGDIHARFAEDKANICKTAYYLNTGYAAVIMLTMIRKMREISGDLAVPGKGEGELGGHEYVGDRRRV
ncbi:alpha-galactosidase [Colletotrichum orchidophilum]|uniref:alpha-galactosidase n=1 Tax=Colletotrichum orchidophilum TaxID=1209926 RepID=A0A1G4B4Q6_9PEZI|nr:alpha-galactosidase [Colletotrichum orchidophilum]OHE96428.1 alpha-galactosidase [Colletotrichum orchidophilum]